MSVKRTLAAASAFAVVAGLAVPTVASAAVLPAPRASDTCQAPGGVGTGMPDGKDNNFSVLVGGDFFDNAAAELEGLLVVGGDARFDGRLYNIGAVGGGSLFAPTFGSDMLLVGGDATITSGTEVKVGIVADTTLRDARAVGGNVRVGGALSVHGNSVPESRPAPDASITGLEVGDLGAIDVGVGASSALAHYSYWTANSFAAIKAFSERNLTNPEAAVGTVDASGELTLTGSADADRHLFTITEAQLASLPGWASLKLENIDPDDVVVIKVEGAKPTVTLTNFLANGSVVDSGSDEFGLRASHMLWVFDEATSVTLSGGIQFPGSMVVPRENAVTKVSVPGFNGRVLVAGDLVHEYGGGEFHAYPFLGDDETKCEPPTPQDAVPVAPQVVQAVCDAASGSNSAPAVTLPEDTAAIRYTLQGDVAEGRTVVVAATAQDGYALSPAAGWTAVSETVATYSVTLDVVDCSKNVDLVTPTLVQAQCAEDGSTIAPELLIANTSDIHYSFDASTVSPGSSVTVTATAQGPVRLQAPAGSAWNVADDGRAATIVVAFESVQCDQPVVPVAPSVVAASCDEDGNVVAPVVTFAETAGLVYSVEGDVTAGSTVVVTAVAADGFFLKPADGWVLADDKKSATYELGLAEIACDQPVVPVAPIVTAASCDEDGNVVAPVVTLAETVGLVYSVEGDVVAGSTVVVTATAVEGHFLRAADGWVLADDKKSATFELGLAEIECDQPVPPTTPVAPGTPTLEEPVCDADGNTRPGAVILPSTEGIVYSYNEDEFIPGDVLTVVATAEDGYEIARAEGWTLAEDQKSASFSLQISDCELPLTHGEVPPVTPEEPAEPGQPAEPEQPEEPMLPQTGAEFAAPLWITGAAVLILAGGVLMLRRRVAAGN